MNCNFVKRALGSSLGLVAFAVLAASGCSSSQPTSPTDNGPANGGSAGTSATGSANGGTAGASTAGATHGGAGAGGNGATGGAGTGTAGTGTAGTGTAGAATMPGTFASVAAIMASNCGAALCHGGGAGGQPLVYTNKATLYNTLTTTVVKECNGVKLVTPGDPAHSALLLLPNWMCTDDSGGPFVMPQGCIDTPCLSKDELDSITAWITAGAPQQ